ncbi:MAG: hypothetical protein JW846_01540 [Dehalococcoidia bacterium]|nr:hypothetical protein [Dehalococcoidia bacterium]
MLTILASNRTFNDFMLFNAYLFEAGTMMLRFFNRELAVELPDRQTKQLLIYE